MKKSAIILFLLLSCALHAQLVWHRPDSLLVFPLSDSVSSTEEYTVFAVFRSLEPDSIQLLWGFTSDDTLRSAVLSHGVFSSGIGICSSSRKRDFSRWSIYSYHTGCHVDSTRPWALRLGPAMANYTKDSVEHADLLPANIAMEEFAYFPYAIHRVQSGSFLTYLALKYGITLDENASYITAAGDTLWSGEVDRDYYHRIVGVGTDTVHGWSTTVSSSKEQAEMSITCSSLDVNEYVIIGDNDGGWSWLPQPDGYYRLEQQWRLRRRTASSKSAILSWWPKYAEQITDTAWLLVYDSEERLIARRAPMEQTGDSVWQFPVMLSDTLMTLHIESTKNVALQRNKVRRNSKNDLNNKNSNETPAGLTARYSSNGMITVGGLSSELSYDFSLYDSAGKLVQLIQNVSDGTALVGTLPTGVYHIEITHRGAIVGDMRIIVN